MIYVNSIYTLEELSKMQEKYDEEKKQLKHKEYITKNKEKLKEYRIKWMANNKERLAAYRNKIKSNKMSQ
jgi:hypothetical protein